MCDTPKCVTQPNVLHTQMCHTTKCVTQPQETYLESAGDVEVLLHVSAQYLTDTHKAQLAQTLRKASYICCLHVQSPVSHAVKLKVKQLCIFWHALCLCLLA